jgi:hypothetical protein
MKASNPGVARGRFVALAVIAIAATACYHHTFTVGAGAPGGTLVHDEWRHHWLWGLVDPDSELELRQVCPSGDATIEGQVTFLNGLVSALTSGIYSPTTVRVRCSGTSADAGVDVDLDAGAVERIVSDPAFLPWVHDALPARLDEARSASEDRRAD